MVVVVSCPRMTDTIVVFSVWAFQHTEDAFVDDSCACCGRMSMTSLWSRLSFLKGLAPSADTHARFSGSSREPPAGALGDLRVTVRASPPGMPPRTSYSSRSEHPVWFPGDFAGPSHRAPSISFGAPSVDRISITASGDGFTSSVRWGCPPWVLSLLPHRTQSWRPCLLGQPWISGWRSTDHPVLSPRGWMIGLSERSMAYNHALLRCLFSQRCMRSWQSRGWPLSWPEATRPSPLSSLPSTAGLPGVRGHSPGGESGRGRGAPVPAETPPLGGTVRVSRKPVRWQPFSRPKLIVLRARQPLPCTPWLSCRFTKPRHSNRCTRVVPTRGWCRSCVRRLTSLYKQRKSSRGPSGRRCPPWWSRSAISGSTWQRWRTSTRHAFSTPPSPRRGCGTPSRALPSSSRQYSNRPRQSSISCPRVTHHPPLPPGPGLRLPVAVGTLLRPPELLRPAPSHRSGPDAGNPEMLEFALSQETARTAPLLPPVEGWEENTVFCFIPRASGTHFLRAGRHWTPSQDSTVSALSQSLPVCWAGITGRCHACCAIPPHPGIQAPFFSSSSVPRMVNPGEILQAPPAVRLGGAVWRQVQY